MVLKLAACVMSAASKQKMLYPLLTKDADCCAVFFYESGCSPHALIFVPCVGIISTALQIVKLWILTSHN